MSAQFPIEFLEYLPEYRVVICTRCKHVVWPLEVRSHFQGKEHRLKKPALDAAEAALERWPRLIIDPEEFIHPSSVQEPVAQLPVIRGYQCLQQPVDCGYICESEKGIKRHLREEHGFKQRNRRGRPSLRYSAPN